LADAKRPRAAETARQVMRIARRTVNANLNI
jgi:hypothetical protein